MIVFDVGANNGTDSERWLHEGSQVHAFEPAPRMLQRLWTIPHLIVNPVAVSDFDGFADFHLSELRDEGCSSLLEFNDELGAHWPDRDDLRVTRTIRVPVIRLDTYMRQQRIESIDYLHIDAQGADLAVLRGLGERASDVRAGRVEAATKPEVALYRGQPVESNIVAWLEAHGFHVTERRNNDSHGNEVNLEFSR